MIKHDDMFREDCEYLMEIICDNYSMYEDEISIKEYLDEVSNYIRDYNIDIYHRAYKERLEHNFYD